MQREKTEVWFQVHVSRPHLHPIVRLGTIFFVSAEQLIALEAAVAELGTLYTVARGFAALQARAEAELLPQLSTLSARLRGLARTARLTDDELDAAAHQIVAVGSVWRLALEQVRASAEYERARAAFAEDRQDALAEVLPRIFAGLHVLRPVPSLYFSVSPASGRRRPGASPFLSPPECADKIVRVIAEGLTPEANGGEWWEHDLPSIACADDPAALETPIWLRLDAADVRVCVFNSHDDPGLRLYTPRLRAPMSVGLAADATDEWWEAYEESYRAFRGALEKELGARGQRVVHA